MKSILENRPALAAEVNKVAEVAGYLWQKGWAERNGGNITVNITEFVDDEIKAMPAISEINRCYFTLFERLLFLLQRHQQAYARFGPLADGKRFGHPHSG